MRNIRGPRIRWRIFSMLALPPLVLIALWFWYGRDTPGEHPAVSREELAELGPTSEPPDASISFERVAAILRYRSIAIVTFSYMCMNYVFYLLASWSFLYLTDAVSLRLGATWGFRLVPLLALPSAGALLPLATFSPNAYVAVLALTGAYCAVEINEAAYWAGTMRIAQGDSMAATGVLNTGGNAGGWIGIPIVAYLSGHGQWRAAFAIGFGCAVIAALGWLWVDVAKPLVDEAKLLLIPTLAPNATAN